MNILEFIFSKINISYVVLLTIRSLNKTLVVKLKDNDNLVITKLDRFTKITIECYKIVNWIIGKDITVSVLNIVLMNNTPESKLMTETIKKKDLVKRVISLSGEHIIIKNNEVFIDDKKLNEWYLNGVNTNGNIDMIVPQNHIFTFGDNREIRIINIDDAIEKIYIWLYLFNKI